MTGLLGWPASHGEGMSMKNAVRHRGPRAASDAGGGRPAAAARPVGRAVAHRPVGPVAAVDLRPRGPAASTTCRGGPSRPPTGWPASSPTSPTRGSSSGDPGPRPSGSRGRARSVTSVEHDARWAAMVRPVAARQCRRCTSSSRCRRTATPARCCRRRPASRGSTSRDYVAALDDVDGTLRPRRRRRPCPRTRASTGRSRGWRRAESWSSTTWTGGATGTPSPHPR